MVELYILYSEKIDQYYVDQTAGLIDRLPWYNAAKPYHLNPNTPQIVTKISIEHLIAIIPLIR